MQDEYRALIKNGTWILVPRPSGANVVTCMWLFKHKFHGDGSLRRYKARLVANGRIQQHGLGCSSVGLGAFTDIGPFGVNPDGETLYAREFAWNQVANLIFLESAAGVGFSYSNTTSDYSFLGDQMTADDTYVFLIKWFKRYTEYQGRDFFLIGESYAGHFIPELADLILKKKKDKASAHIMDMGRKINPIRKLKFNECLLIVLVNICCKVI